MTLIKYPLMVFTALIVWFSAALPCAAGPAVITLDRALELAFARNPALTVSQKELEAAKGRLTQARSGYLPQVSVSSGYDRRYSDSAGGTVSRGGNYSDDYTARASLSQLIYDFGFTGGKIDRSLSNLESSQKSLEEVAAALYRDVKIAYLEVLRNQRLVAVNQESLQVQQKHLAQAQALYKQGMRPRIDVTKGETEVSQAKLVLLQAEYAQKNALANLERLMGGPPGDADYRLADVETGRRPPERVDPLIAKALGMRPDMAQLKSQVEAALAGLRSVSGGFWPTLSATGSYTLSGDNPELDDSAWQTGLTLRWDIFTGFRQSGAKSEARAEIGRLQALVKSKELSVTREVTQAYLALMEAYQAVAAAKTALMHAKQNMSQAEGRYQAGRSTAVELSDAQVLYTSSQSALVRATYTHMQAWASLQYATGETPELKPFGKQK